MTLFWCLFIYTVGVVLFCALEYKAYIRNGKFMKRAFLRDVGAVWMAVAGGFLHGLWEMIKITAITAGKIIDWLWSMIKFVVNKARQD